MDFTRRLALIAALLFAPLASRAQSTTPALTQAMPAQTIAMGGAPLSIDLRPYFSLPGVTGQVAQFNTVLGTFNVELLASAAPLSVANFLTYVGNGAYTNTIIHRSTSLNADGVSNWIVQGGGFDLGPNPIATNAPIPLEYNLPNIAGTLAMARTNVLNSATSQWFLNVNDNTTVLGPSNGGGYAVFGRVLGTGMSVVNAIAAVPIYNASGGNAASPFTNLPLQNVTAGQTTIQTTNLIVINSITVVPVFPVDNTTPSVLTFTPANNSSAVVSATISGSTLTLTPIGLGTATISVRAADTNGNFASGAFNVTVAAGTAPAIDRQPSSQNVAQSSTVVFSVAASGLPTPTYQWRFNGVDIPGMTGALLVLQGVSPAQAGSYSCLVSNSVGSATSNAATLTVNATSDPGRLINLSVLTDISASVPNFTVATVIGPANLSGTKSLLVRAAGPGLGALGYPSTVSDPQFSLYNSSSQVIATNNDWSSSLTTTMASLGAFPFPANSLDAAANPTGLLPGNYSVIVSGVGGATGNVIAEIWDSTTTYTPSSPRLINVSVLKQIPSGGGLSLGFTVKGSTATTVLIRVIGPALGLPPFNIGGVMADPLLTLYDNTTGAVIATNDDWGADTQLISVGTRVNAFPIGSAATKDSMLLITLPVPLPQGSGYTARATGNGSSSGYAIVEVYEVP